MRVRGGEFALVFFAVKQGLIRQPLKRRGLVCIGCDETARDTVEARADTVPELTQIRDIKLNTQVSL